MGWKGFCQCTWFTTAYVRVAVLGDAKKTRWLNIIGGQWSFESDYYKAKGYSIFEFNWNTREGVINFEVYDLGRLSKLPDPLDSESSMKLPKFDAGFIFANIARFESCDNCYHLRRALGPDLPQLICGSKPHERELAKFKFTREKLANCDSDFASLGYKIFPWQEMCFSNEDGVEGPFLKLTRWVLRDQNMYFSDEPKDEDDDDDCL